MERLIFKNVLFVLLNVTSCQVKVKKLKTSSVGLELYKGASQGTWVLGFFLFSLVHKKNNFCKNLAKFLQSIQVLQNSCKNTYLAR